MTVLNLSALLYGVDITTGSCKADVGYGWRTKVFDAAIVIRTGTEILKESFAATQQDGHNHKMHLID